MLCAYYCMLTRLAGDARVRLRTQNRAKTCGLDYSSCCGHRQGSCGTARVIINKPRWGLQSGEGRTEREVTCEDTAVTSNFLHTDAGKALQQVKPLVRQDTTHHPDAQGSTDEPVHVGWDRSWQREAEGIRVVSLAVVPIHARQEQQQHPEIT